MNIRLNYDNKILLSPIDGRDEDKLNYDTFRSYDELLINSLVHPTPARCSSKDELVEQCHQCIRLS